MTKPLIKLPSVELREAYEELSRVQAKIAEVQAENADKDAEIARLKKLLAEKGC